MVESVKLKGGKIEVVCRNTDAPYVKNLLDAWYLQKAELFFEKRVVTMFEELKWVKQKPTWKMRAMKKQWGSCSKKGLLSLNPALIKAPRECIDYVIVHELCHLKEDNHSKAYFRLLTRSMNDWKARKQRLDGMAELLLNV
jgi:predicted metal-dependent hydrolase